MAESNISMKLLIDRHGKRVLLAEVNKNCVDFLFNLLSLPIAKVIRIFGQKGMVGSVGYLYESIENLDDAYIQPNQSKDDILKRKVLDGSSEPPLLLNDATAKNTSFYKCPNTCATISEEPSTICPDCSYQMATVVRIVQATTPPPGQQECNEGGFVKGVVTYLVMDNLAVMPMSIISSITLLNKFNVKDVSALEEKVVNLSMDKARELIKASLQSKTVLTDVFLKGTD